MNNPFFNRLFPYTNLNDINLDWILNKLKSFKESLEAQAADVSEALVAAQHADATATSAQNAATNAQNAATVALERANSVEGLAQSAVSTAQAAEATAQAAEATANAIASTANNALTVAQAAETTAAQANSTAQSAVETAEAAAGTAADASADANNAEQTAMTALATAQAAYGIAQSASGDFGITGAEEDELIKIGSVDADGTPLGWEVAEKGIDYADPDKYALTGATVSNNNNIGIRTNSIMAVWESNDPNHHPLSISENSSNNLVVGVAVTVGDGSVCTLVGHVVSVQAQLKTLFPNLAPIIDPVTNRVHSAISGFGNAAFGIGVNVTAAQAAAAFGTTQRVTGNSSFTTGGMNYVSGQYSTACGRYLEAKSNNQTVVGRANDNKSEDAFEVGNGSASASAVTRSNAFRVTTNGKAIAKAALGIEDGNGGTVEITAAQLQALLALLN